MNFLLKHYQYINILSLDVVAGAVIGALFFSRIMGITVSLFPLIALALTVWIIYTADHLRDAMFIPKMAATDRHKFHQKHFRVVTGILCCIMVIDLAFIWLTPQKVLVPGIALGSVVVIYLVLQRSLKFMKEFFVAGLYTAGILLPSISFAAWELQTVHSIVIGKYIVTAWINLLLFSLIEHEADLLQKQHSFVTWFGPESTRIGILLLGLLNIASGLWLLTFDPGVATIFIMMNILLLAIFFFREHLVTNNSYRLAGDAVFFIPALYLL